MAIRVGTGAVAGTALAAIKGYQKVKVIASAFNRAPDADLFKFESTFAVKATTWQNYEKAIQDMYGEVPLYKDREFSVIVNGQKITGVADQVVLIDGKMTAIDAKFVDEWDTSIRNPNSPVGGRSFAEQEQIRVQTHKRVGVISRL